MPTAGYIKIIGSTSANMTEGSLSTASMGNKHVANHDAEMIVHEVKHVVTVPTDPLSGQPSGQRIHKPFIVTFPLCKAIPLLYNALASGELLTEVVYTWWRTSDKGVQEDFFTTTLTDAIIVDMSLAMPHVEDSPASDNFTQLIDVSMTYRKIDWAHTKASSVGSDDWREPIV